MKFSHGDTHGKLIAEVTLDLLWNRTYALHRVVPEKSGVPTPALTWRQPVKAAIAAAREADAEEIMVRVTETGDWEAYLAMLAALGFEKRSDRIEYTAPVAELPEEHDSPFTWQPLAPLGPWSVEQAAELIGRVAVGDPDFDPSEDTLGLLQGYLADPELTTGPDCVHIGLLDGQPAAVVIAQVKSDSGWSRITYMGLAPEHRAKGLGQHVHRHGFAMMRAQGGVTYHGGTLQDNGVMRSLFVRSGCAEDRRLQEWSLKL